MRVTCSIGRSSLLLLVICAIVAYSITPCHAQSVFASRSFVPPSIDGVAMVTDWKDSVYVVTNSGRVIAYDTLFTRPRPLTELSSVYVNLAFVYEESLFFHSAHTGTAIYTLDGNRQFINWELSLVGFNHRMQPFFVTPDGTFTLSGADHGAMTVVRHDIQVPCEVASQYAFFDRCAVVVRKGTDSEVFHQDGSRSPLALGREDIQRLACAVDSSSLVVMETTSVVHIGRDVCANPQSMELVRFTPTEVFNMNGASFRTSANAPLVLFYGHYQMGTAKVVLSHRGGDFDTSYNSLVSQQQRTASTTDRAMYLWGRDGKVIRISLDSRFISKRPTEFCDNCQITGSIASYNKSSGNTLRLTVVEASPDKRYDVLIVENDSTIRRLSFEDTLLLQSPWAPAIRLYHVFPNGTEFLQIGSQIGTRRDSQPWQVRQAPSLFPRAIDSTSIYFESERSLLRYHAEGDSLKYQYLPAEVRGVVVDEVRSYLIFSGSDSLYVMRRNDWNSTPNFISAAVPGRVVGEADGRIVLMRRFIPNAGGSNTDFDSLQVYFLDVELKKVDSVSVRLPGKLGTAVLFLVVSDTVRVLDLGSRLNYTIGSTGSLRVDSVRRRPGVSLSVSLTYRFLSDNIISLSSIVGREVLIDFDSNPPTSVDVLDIVNTVTPHIFMMNVYPNPGTSSATLEMRRHGSSDASATELFLVDLQGNRIREFSATADFRFTVGTIGRATLDYAGIPSGQYLLVIRNGGVTSSKLVSITR
jgi:hypothetical protein